MKFTFGKQDMPSLERAEESCWLLTNGLGGYMSATMAYSVNRGDMGILISSVQAPNHRMTLVHRLSEELTVRGERTPLSSQSYADGRAPETGYRALSSFEMEYAPRWCYEVSGVQLIRHCAMEYGANTAAILYTVHNRSGADCRLDIRPWLQFAPKGDAPQEKKQFALTGNTVSAEGQTLYIKTDGGLTPEELTHEQLYYAYDERDGRTASGYVASCCKITCSVPAGASAEFELILSDAPVTKSGRTILEEMVERRRQLERQSGLTHEVARQLALSADAFLVRRASTGGDSIIAGYPFFGDWGRDTMIALPGCTLSTRRYDTAKSILRTFLAYEKDGLVPNLFPEGTAKPEYNTVDAALLLINSIWLYHQKTGDTDFVREAWPVLKRIVSAYQTGTHYGIGMDKDGLIRAGEGLAQVTWMDVCVEGILPTPRHGKPVEINAYWYNALCVMEQFAPLAGEDGTEYGRLAQKVKESFVPAFWMPERGCLKDVVSGTRADTQIRCNQIWAVTMPFTMLSHEQEVQVVDTVHRHLYTPCGLRTLSPEDPEFHPTYGGPQRERDMAYHQGTVWPFPVGAYYLARLKVGKYAKETADEVGRQLDALYSALREGCIGQIPEIYDGLVPTFSRGCFAQAWSVGELLRVYEALEEIKRN